MVIQLSGVYPLYFIAIVYLPLALALGGAIGLVSAVVLKQGYRHIVSDAALAGAVFVAVAFGMEYVRYLRPSPPFFNPVDPPPFADPIALPYALAAFVPAIRALWQWDRDVWRARGLG